mgnify:CR=1 FL=1
MLTTASKAKRERQDETKAAPKDSKMWHSSAFDNCFLSAPIANSSRASFPFSLSVIPKTIVERRNDKRKANAAKNAKTFLI